MVHAARSSHGSAPPPPALKCARITVFTRRASALPPCTARTCKPSFRVRTFHLRAFRRLRPRRCVPPAGTGASSCSRGSSTRTGHGCILSLSGIPRMKFFACCAHTRPRRHIRGNRTFAPRGRRRRCRRIRGTGPSLCRAGTGSFCGRSHPRIRGNSTFASHAHRRRCRRIRGTGSSLCRVGTKHFRHTPHSGASNACARKSDGGCTQGSRISFLREGIWAWALADPLVHFVPLCVSLLHALALRPCLPFIRQQLLVSALD
jgi:hypothetical protein